MKWNRSYPGTSQRCCKVGHAILPNLVRSNVCHLLSAYWETFTIIPNMHTRTLCIHSWIVTWWYFYNYSIHLCMIMKLVNVHVIWFINVRFSLPCVHIVLYQLFSFYLLHSSSLYFFISLQHPHSLYLPCVPHHPNLFPLS